MLPPSGALFILGLKHPVVSRTEMISAELNTGDQVLMYV